MIPQENRNAIKEVSSGVTSSDFSIEVNASMFKMLMADVYTDPIKAVIREWSTNACDACLEAGVPVKFDVHLPVAGESTFSVRDYGTGLSPEVLTGLFTVLGASTKRDSNKYNGTLG
jgi:DNA topoisomerase VI subunit B